MHGWWKKTVHKLVCVYPTSLNAQLELYMHEPTVTLLVVAIAG